MLSLRYSASYQNLFVSFSRPELKPVEKETEVVLRFPEVEKLSPPILMLSDVSFKYDKDARTIFSNVDLSATMESRICIVSLAGMGPRL